MGLPDASKTHIEVVVEGLVSDGGAGSFKTDNVFHFRRTSTTNPFNKANFDTVFQNNIVVVLALALNNGWTQQHNAIRSIDDPTDPVSFYPHAAVGGRAGDRMTAIDTAYILMRTGLRGPRYKGNKKFGPLSESDSTTPDDDLLNAASKALWNNLITAMGTPLVDATPNTWKLEILSRRPPADYQALPAVVVGNDVTEILLNQRIGRLKRRERKSVY